MCLANQFDARKLAGLALCLALGGCPQLMKDDFQLASSRAGAAATGGSTGHGTDAGADETDAGQGGSGEHDAGLGGTTNLATGGAATGGCHYGTFASPERISGLSVTGEQWGPSLSADSLTMYFGLWDGMSDRVYVAERADRRRYFSSANRVTILGTTLAPAEPFLSDDGLKLYFVTGSANSADRDIWSATRESTTLTTFSAAQAVAAVNSAYEEASPWLSEDELTLLFSTARPGGSGDLDIWRATRELATGAFSSPTVLAGVNSAGRDESPVLSQDGLTLYFTTTRESVTGKQDVWYATRNSLDEEFGVPAALEAVNSDAVETDIALSTDGAELFFVSDRLGSPQIWHATRGCE